MKQILFNLALMEANSFCAANGINYAGSHLVKNGRGFTYTLVFSETKRPILDVTFHKMKTPTHRIY